MLIANTEEQAIKIAQHLSASLDTDLKRSTSSLSQEEISFLESAADDFQLWKIKLFSADGYVLYSSDAEDIGDVNEHDYFHETVKAGSPYSIVVAKESNTLEGQIALADVVETYVPVMVGSEFQGAFEIYLDITQSKNLLDQLVARTSGLTLGISFLMLLVILAVVLRAANDVQQRVKAQKAVVESEIKFRQMSDSAQDAILMVDEFEKVTFWNDAATRIFGYFQEEILGKGIQTILPQAQFFEVSEDNAPILIIKNIGTGGIVEMLGKRKNGQDLPVELSVAHIYQEGVDQAICILRDLSKRKEYEHALQLSAQVLEHSIEGIMITNSDHIIQMANPAFTKITGYSIEDVIGKTPMVLSSGRHDVSFYEKIWRDVEKKGGWQGEIWNRRKDGSLYLEWLSISSINDSNGQITHYVAIFSDFTQRKKVEQNLETMAFHDALTGLPNRTLFIDRLTQAIKPERDHPEKLAAVLFMDLNKFKQVNDTFGHAVGDGLLQAVGSRLSGQTRDGDTVARYGGDEFAILLPSIKNIEEAISVAERIYGVFVQPIIIEGHECSVGISVGISLYPLHGETASALLEKADEAMYEAKHKSQKQPYAFAR
jgi:diguanylate cyclase (GGDEF)-like protein/PAS domain S-box-containing protein